MDLGWPEVLLILAVVMIVFGVGKLPQVASQMGKAVREFRQSQRMDDDEDKKETRVLVGAGGSGNVAVIESTAQPSSSQSGGSNTQSELAATKARLAAAEARLRQLEESTARSQGTPQAWNWATGLWSGVSVGLLC